jgi:hypothetical protein
MDGGKEITWLSQATGLNTFPVVVEQWRRRRQNLIPRFEKELKSTEKEVESLRIDEARSKANPGTESEKATEVLTALREVAERRASAFRFAINEIKEFYRSIHNGNGFEANLVMLKDQLKALDARNYRVPKYRLVQIPEELKALHAVGFLAFRYKKMLEERASNWGEGELVMIVRDSLKPPLDVTINETLRLLEKYGYDDDDIDEWRPQEDSDDASSMVAFARNPVRSGEVSADDSLVSIPRSAQDPR